MDSQGENSFSFMDTFGAKDDCGDSCGEEEAEGKKKTLLFPTQPKTTPIALPTFGHSLLSLFSLFLSRVSFLYQKEKDSVHLKNINLNGIQRNS
jgi:hypothetical protein